MNTIHKIGAVILKDGKILVGRKRDTFIIPGGRIEAGESEVVCLRRELKEELRVELVSQRFFGRFEDEAALDPGMKIKMTVYVVEISGEPIASNEIEEIKYVDSQGGERIGSILEKFVIPNLVKEGLME